MAPTLEARRAAFAHWVQRQLDYAKQSRGWSVPKIAEVAGIGNPTIYRWRDGNWRKGPLPEQVVAFCNALDVPPSEAFSILWPGKEERPTPTRELPLDPDVKVILRRLADPNVSQEEKTNIRAMLRYLANLADQVAERPAKKATPRRRATG